MHRRNFCKNSLAAGIALAIPACGKESREASPADGQSIDAVTGDGNEITIERAAVDEFSEILEGTLYLSSSAGYDDARRIWNGMIDHRPALIAQCTSEQDVRNAVTFAAERDLLVSVRGGGHSYSGKSVCNDGLMIDLSRMQSVTIDPANRTARVQGGALLAHLDAAALAKGMLTTTGIISHTGVGGFTLGGGMGRVDRLFGLAVDNIVEATLVTPDGRSTIASEEENADLFWAIRGGGGNFGVASDFVYRLHPFEPTVYGGTFYFSFDNARRVLELYAESLDRLPREANIEPGFEFDEGERRVYVSVCVPGKLDAAEAICAPFAKIAKPLGGAFGPRSYLQMQTQADNYYAHGRLNYLKSGLLPELSPSLITAMVESYEGEWLPDVWFQHLGGATSEIATDATAYFRRNAVANLGISATWDDPEQSENRIAKIRSFYNNVAPHMEGYYANLNDQAAPQDHSNFGSNYARLVDIKTRYDPANLFRLNDNIKPNT